MANFVSAPTISTDINAPTPLTFPQTAYFKGLTPTTYYFQLPSLSGTYEISVLPDLVKLVYPGSIPSLGIVGGTPYLMQESFFSSGVTIYRQVISDGTPGWVPYKTLDTKADTLAIQGNNLLSGATITFEDAQVNFEPATTKTVGGVTTEYTDVYVLAVDGQALADLVASPDPSQNFTPDAGRFLVTIGDPTGQRTQTWGNFIDTQSATEPSQPPEQPPLDDFLLQLDPTEAASAAPPVMDLSDAMTAPIAPIISPTELVLGEFDAVGAILQLDAFEVEVAQSGKLLLEESLELKNGLPSQFGMGFSAAAAAAGLLVSVDKVYDGWNTHNPEGTLNGFAGIVQNLGNLLSLKTGGVGAIGAGISTALEVKAAIDTGSEAKIANAIAKGAIVGSFATIGFILGAPTGSSGALSDIGASVGGQIFNAANYIGTGLANSKGFNDFLDNNPQLLTAYNTGGFSGLFNQVTTDIWNSAPAALKSVVQVQQSGTLQNFSLDAFDTLSLQGNAQAAATTPVTVTVSNPLDAMFASIEIVSAYLFGSKDNFPATTLQNDYLGITRTNFPLDAATLQASLINIGTQTEAKYVNNLLFQVENTTMPAVAVEASMYGAVGSSKEVSALATEFLPSQIANAVSNGYHPLVYSAEALGLVFAFNNEDGSTAFANTFGPSNAVMPNSAAGDAAFAGAAANAIFGAASTATLLDAIQTWVSNWKAFYSLNGVSGIPNATADQIDLAARGAAWGDAVGLALDNNLGALKVQSTEFLMDAAQGIANYSAPLVGQPHHNPFQGELV